MDIVGYACSHPRPPLRQAYLPMSGLTVLLGANDVGKSSVLAAITRDLSGGHFASENAEEARESGGVFYVNVSPGERDELIARAVREEQRRETDDRTFLGDRPPWARARYAGELPELDGAPSTSWLRCMTRHKGARAAPSVLDELRGSTLMAFEPAGLEVGTPVWNLYWCLGPAGSLSPAVREALDADNLAPEALGRRGKNQVRGGGPSVLRYSMDTALYGFRKHLRIDGAPVVVSAVGQIRNFDVPQGLGVPADFATLRRGVASGLNELTSCMRHGLHDAQLDGDALTADEETSRVAPRNWIDAAGGAVTLHPDARGAAAFVSASADRLLAPFVRHRYRLRVDVNPVEEWVGDSAAALSISLRSRREDGLVEEFPVEDAADGLQLWVQLALLEACEQASRAGRALTDLAADWWDHVRDLQYGPDGGEEASELADEAERRFNEMVTDIRALSSRDNEWLTGELRGFIELGDAASGGHGATRNPPLFVIDEPERHLHPALQRSAALWLKETSRERGARSIVASHSASFLGLPTDGAEPSFVHIARNGAGGVECLPFNAGDLRDLNEIREAVGLDRGELLTTVAMFLIVEGVHDVVFLDTVFPELRDARIVVLALDGLSNYEAVLTSDALWRFTTASVALATDKFEPDLLKRVVGDPKEAKKLRRSNAKEETKILAKLLGVAERAGKQVHLVGHTGADLIDVLDEEVVQKEFSDYPGHAAAQQLWNAELASGEKAGKRKAFFEAKFGIPENVVTYERLARAHVAQGRKPVELQGMVDRARKIAAGSFPDGVVSSAGPEIVG